ncbi:DUF885 domain-containing protein [Thalassotalea ponticola]|uniref:DUF885 domain-containing protein n=1 Tax=Thalassotalea ponticola TaxID=1523392 RepID=UPI0025B2E219|nr:DUF885 domain-containing protein [Thalassotalea ponticola]MDN3652203.1 DUF885 domain-containing protein [Thalassotalea ponticola]
MRTKKSLLALALSSAFLAACTNTDSTASSNANNTATEVVAEQNAAVAETESQRLNAFFEKVFMDTVMRSPQMQTYLGIRKDYDKWDEFTEQRSAEDLQFAKDNLAALAEFDYDKLDDQTKISYQLAKSSLEQEINSYKWRHHNYPVNQMFGIHSNIPSMLINQHTIANSKEANDYIGRLNGVEKVMQQLVEQLKIRENKGIIAPSFVFPHVIRDSQNLINGAPFTDGDDSTLFADFKSKVAKLDIDDSEKETLINDAKTALLSSVQSGYQHLIDYLIELEPKSTNDAGAWKFPNGAEYYNVALKRTTTTDLTAEQIHQIGLQEVARIHDEMRTIKDKVGFKGDLQAFMQFMRTDKQFYYPNTEQGKQRYLDEATYWIDDMKTRLDELFIVKPKADLVVKRVEAFREQSAGKAFYNRPAPDGSRPGIYYANLYDMEAMPTYQMEALAYHEGIPGHHMQLAISQELEGIPTFRKFASYTAYSEGWGLYSELLPKEIGLYENPYSDFGRLAMELWRACRLVVDTGMHTKKWTREQSIDYYVNNTPNAKSDAVKMVERHAVMPSQATAYKVGMLEILRMRDMAKEALGDKFDIREFHEVYLKNGPLPLDVMQTMMENYIKEKQGA